MDKDKIIRELIERVDLLSKRIAHVEAENLNLKNRVHDLEVENTELKARLNSNSSNSSKPPSSDGYRKQPAFPKKKKGNQGGQPGHKGRTLNQVKNPDKTVACKPDSCDCGHAFTEEEMKLAEKRQVFDFPQPKLEVTEYQIHKAVCPLCGLLHKGVAPKGVNAPVQYGNGVKSYAVLLNVHFKLPFKKIHLLFGDLFGYRINESTVYSATNQCYENLESTEEIIK